MSESTQKLLGRIRPPRVQITYDVEVGDAIIMKQLPFVVGIMADLSGKREKQLPPLKERKFVFVDRDNVDQVLAAAAPRLAFQVPNKLSDDPEKLNVELKFKEMDDFMPAKVAKQVPDLEELLVSRQKLVDLLGKIDGNDTLDHLIQEFIRDDKALKDLVEQSTAGIKKIEEEEANKKADDSDEAGASTEPPVETESPKPAQKEKDGKSRRART